MSPTAIKRFKGIHLLVEANFYIAVLVLVVGSVLSVSAANPIFEFNNELYGPLGNNLRIMMVYLAFSEILFCFVCFVTRSTQYLLVYGLFLALMSGSIEIYSLINDIPVDPNLSIFFLYTGGSQCLFGFFEYLKKMDIE